MARAILSHDPELGTTLTTPTPYGTEPETLRTTLTTLGWNWVPAWAQWHHTITNPTDTDALAAARTIVTTLTDWDVDVHVDTTTPTATLLNPADLDIIPGDWVRSQRTTLESPFVRIDLFGTTPRTETGDPWRQVTAVTNTGEPTVTLTDPHHLDDDGHPTTFPVPVALLSGHHPTR